jgi:two-component system NtrC family sensor kinase
MMIKKSIFIFLFLFAGGLAYTQTRQVVDSLKQQLADAKDDTSRINAQIALCLLYRLGNTDSSLMYGQQALESASKIKYFRGQVTVLGFMCIAMEQRGNLPKSLELGFTALRIAEENNLKALTGPALDGIGEAYIILKDYPKAISYLRRYLLHQNAQGLAYAYFDLGVAFSGLNQLDSANFYEQKAIEAFKKINYEEPLVYQAIGDIKIKSGDLSNALDYYQMSLSIALKNNEPRASTYAYNKIAALYKTTGEPDSAIRYAQKGFEESRLINQKKTILEAAVLLSELYEPKDTKVSLDYLKIATSYKDSLFGAGNIEAVQTLVTQEEKRQSEIAADKIAFRNQLKQYGLIGVLVILLIVAFFLYRNNRKEKAAKRLLQNKNEVIEQTLDHLKLTQAQLVQSEKMASLGELTAGIAHEIQNPLNFVNNFSEVNNELIDEVKDQREKLKKEELDALLDDIFCNNEKIITHGKRADAIVKGMLQHSRSGSGQKEPTDINALCDEYLRLAYHGLRAKDKTFNVKIETSFDDSIGKINVVTQDIGRVVLNLITNAFYAVPLPPKGGFRGSDYSHEPTVWVSTKKEGNKILIKVRDNGPGIPANILEKIFQPFFTTKPAGEGTGLGLSLSYDIIKAHGGEIKVESKEGEGTTFIITIPFT